MDTWKIAAVAGLMLAAGAAEAQKAPPATDAPAPAPEAGAAPAAGGLILASDPQGVLAAMQALGYTASLGVDGANDPMISGELDGTSYNLVFYGCEQNANCKWLLFSAGFDLPNGSTLDVINEWNSNQIVGQAYLDAQSDPFLNYFVTTTGGLTQENFADVVDWWRVALGDFKSKLGI